MTSDAPKTAIWLFYTGDTGGDAGILLVSKHGTDATTELDLPDLEALAKELEFVKAHPNRMRSPAPAPATVELFERVLTIKLAAARAARDMQNAQQEIPTPWPPWFCLDEGVWHHVVEFYTNGEVDVACGAGGGRITPSLTVHETPELGDVVERLKKRIEAYQSIPEGERGTADLAESKLCAYCFERVNPAASRANEEPPALDPVQ